jgi:hypothetical protein
MIERLAVWMYEDGKSKWYREPNAAVRTAYLRKAKHGIETVLGIPIDTGDEA